MNRLRFPIPDNLYRNDDFVERLSCLIRQSSRTKTEWIAAIGVSYSVLRIWLRGEHLPDAKNLRAICITAKKFGCTNITTDWLLSMCDYTLKFTEDF